MKNRVVKNNDLKDIHSKLLRPKDSISQSNSHDRIGEMHFVLWLRMATMNC
jgi:hypothetical protein